MSLPAMKPDRRRTARISLDGLAYISFEPDNGGIVLDVSEDGLGFHAVAPIHRHDTLSFSFSASGNRVQAEGVLAWTDATHKTGGLRFNALSPEAREQVRIWMGQSSRPFTAEKKLAAPIPQQERVAPASTTVRRTLPSALRPLSQWVRMPLHWSEFSRGLAAGLLVAVLVAAGFLFDARRQQIGRMLIRLGETFESAPQTRVPSSPVQPPATSAPEASVPLRISAPHVSPAPPAVASSPASRSLPPQEWAKTAVRPNEKPVHNTPPETPPARSAPLPAASAPATSAPTPTTVANPPVPAAPAATASLNLPATGNAAQPAPVVHANNGAKVLPAKSNGPYSENAEDILEINSDMALGKYFDIGSFKDRLEAAQIRRDLSDLGLRAVVLPKSLLWMKSYQVLVGPYHNEQDAQGAGRTLQARGFKPRPLAKRSRELTLVAPWSSPYSGPEQDIQDFRVTWEAYSADAAVKFLKGGQMSAAADGKWVKLPAKSDYTAIIYTTDDVGRRTLLSIQFRGMKQAVVLPSSADHGIVF